MPTKFHVTAPDGHTVEVTGPDGATEEQAIQQAQQLYKPKAVPANPSDKIPAAKPPTPAGLRQGDPLPSVPTMGGEAVRNLANSLDNWRTSGFGMNDTNQMHPDMSDTPGASLGNFGRNLGKSLSDTARDVGQTFMHPAESFAQDPIGTANTIGTAARGAAFGPQELYGSLSKVTPERGMNRVFKPSPADADFPTVSPGALSDVKRFGGPVDKTIFGKPKLGVDQLRRGIEAPSPADITVKTLQEQGLEPWMDRARKMGIQIPGDEIVAATRRAIPELMRVRDPQGAMQLEQQAQQAFGGRNFSPDQFRDFLKTDNGSLQSFYNKSAGAQSAAEIGGTPTAIEKAQNDAVRDMLYRHLDPENAGAGPRSIQERTGNVLNLRNAAERRSSAILGEKPATPFEALMTPGLAVFRALKGRPGEGLSTLVHPFKGPSDAMITKMYRQFPKGGDLPQPGASPAWANKRLGPATLAGDTSGPLPQGVGDFRSVDSEFAPRQPLGIAAPPTPLGVSGTTVPDVVGRSSRGAGGPRALLPAPESGIPPVTILPRGPGVRGRLGAIGPAGTVPETSTEAPRPMPGTLGGRLLDYLEGRRGPIRNKE